MLSKQEQKKEKQNTYLNTCLGIKAKIIPFQYWL